MIRVLFIVPYPTKGASNRLRVEQYFSHLKSCNIKFSVRPFISKSFYEILYKDKFYISKLFYFGISVINRILDLLRAVRCDVIFIHREAFPVGPALFEYIIATLGKPIIYDFDDAIFLLNTSRPNSFIERFKMPEKIAHIISLSKMVIAGNKYLYDFASRFNHNVKIIPTSIDTDIYRVNFNVRSATKDVTIGWIGSYTTICFLHLLEDVFLDLSAKYQQIKFKIVGGMFSVKGLSNIVSKPWSLESEVDDLRSFDVGIMPMPDNEWTKGKCGFKAILYMSMMIPAVCSPVGMNVEIIQNGVNGFLADSRDDWIKKLSILIENPELRKNMGKAGRLTVEQKYSIRANASNFLDVIKSVYCENIK